MLRYVPPLRWRKRAVQMDFREWTYGAIVDPASEPARQFKELALDMLHSQLPDQPEMWEKLTPKYTLGCKRIIISDDYYPALNQDNVSLETRPIAGVNGNHVKVKTDSGDAADTDTDYDLLVCATGFRTLEFMHPIKIYGKGGRSLNDIWKDGAHGYNGTCVTDLPNFGMLYGPNTNLGHNSIILMIEAQSKYVNGLIKPVLEARKQGKSLSLRPKDDKVKAYNERVQEVLKNSSFNDSTCNSWYKNEQGMITNNWSGTVVEYQEILSKVDYNDYIAEGKGKGILERQKSLKLGRVVEETQVGDKTLLALGLVSTAAVVGGFLLRNSKHLTPYLNSIKLR